MPRSGDASESEFQKMPQRNKTTYNSRLPFNVDVWRVHSRKTNVHRLIMYLHSRTQTIGFVPIKLDFHQKQFLSKSENLTITAELNLMPSLSWSGKMVLIT